MLKKDAQLTEAKVISRQRYNKRGVLFKFRTIDDQTLVRTFTFPELPPLGNTKFSIFLTRLGVLNSPVVRASPILLVTEISSECVGKSYSLSLEESGNDDYPYNITSILSEIVS